ncbi:NAD(P)-binding protein [Aspergillus falconensis]
MVHVVLAGGAGNVGREVLDVLVERQKYQLTVFTRTEAIDLAALGVNVVQVDYNDKDMLTGPAQKNLIDACIKAGVKRFAPSEWATYWNTAYSNLGWFMNYLSFPYPSTKHLQIFGLQYDLQNRSAIVPADRDFPMTLTKVQDLAKVVAEAIDYEGQWPEKRGISGSRITNSELIELADSIRGPFEIETVQAEAIEAGELNTSWVPLIELPSMPPGTDVRAFSEAGISSVLTGALSGTWAVSDEWNKLLPDLKMTTVQEFLRDIWGGKHGGGSPK